MVKKENLHFKIAWRATVVLVLLLASFIYLGYGGLTGHATGIFDDSQEYNPEDLEFNSLDHFFNEVGNVLDGKISNDSLD